MAARRAIGRPGTGAAYHRSHPAAVKRETWLSILPDLSGQPCGHGSGGPVTGLAGLGATGSDPGDRIGLPADQPGADRGGGSIATVTAPPMVGTRSVRRQLQRERAARMRRRIALVAIPVLVAAGLMSWAVVNSSPRHHAAGTSSAAAARTQTTLLVQLSGGLQSAVASALVAHDPATQSGAVILIPSGLISQVPGFGSMPFGQALSLGDLNAPRDTLADLMGVTVDGAWALTPSAFARLVDAVGGVTVTVDHDVTRTSNAGTVIVVPAGTRRLSGEQAAAFASFLADGEAEQQRLARFDAVWNAVLSGLPKDPGQVARLLAGLGSGSRSTFTADRLAGLLVGFAADAAQHQTSDQLLPVKALDTVNGSQAFSLDTVATAKLVQQELAQSVPANQKLTGNRVMVENQLGTPGLAETTRSKLERAGFVYVQGPNAPTMPNPTAPSAVLIFDTSSSAIAKGYAVARALGLPTSDVKVASPISVADVVVMVGADYRP